MNIEQGNPAQPEAAEEVGPQPEAGPPEHMNQEIENVDKDAGGDVLLPQARAAENFSIGTPTNSPEKSAVGDTHLEEKRIKVSERRIATPERNQPQKRRGSVDKDSPAKRLILDDDGADPDETNEALGIPAFDMEFEDPGDIRDEGAAGSSDPMIGFFKGLNIVDLTEFFSPPRGTRMCREFDLQPGESLDLMTGWDFDLEEHRRLAMERVKRDKPTMVVGSPPCTFFSTLQELNKHNNRDNPTWIAQFNANLEKAVRHIKFCVQIYKVQMDAGRYWLHEHPWSAKSWQIPELKELLEDPRVEIAYADQCQFGLTAPIAGINGERGPAKKPTGFAGNSWTVMEELRRKCPGDHIHVRLEGGKAKQAAIYTEDLCRTICRGIRRQVDYDAKGLKCMGSIDKGGLETLIKDMIDTAEEYLDQHDDPNGSRGELPPTTDEAGRVAEKKEDAVEQCPQPKPVSQKKQGKLSWASLTEEEELTDMENQIEHALIENAKFTSWS